MNPFFRRAAYTALAVTLLAACTTPVASPTSTSTTPTPWAMPVLDPSEVAITTSDGLTIIGTLRGEGPVGVILGHMFLGTADDWTPLANALVVAGYRVLAIDFRGSGRSEPPLEIPGLHLDLEAAATYLRELGATSVALVGASMGGAAVIEAAAAVDAVALVAMAAPSNFGGVELTREEIAALAMPKLFIVADGDLVRAQFDGVIAAAPAPKEEMRLAGKAHGTRLFKSEHRDAVIERIVGFLQANAPL